jgi:copper chaperone CopZ
MMHAMASHPLSAFYFGLQEIVLKVNMCCGKCEEKVKEEIRDLDGVTDVKTDREKSKVTVVGKADKSQVLKKAKKVDWRAKVLEVKKGEVAEKKVEEKKKEEPKKKEEKKEEPNTTWTNDPRNYYPTFYPPYYYPYPAAPPPAFGPDGTYRPSQAYPPHYYQYPETDYSYYNYPNNPRYLTHIRHS